MSYLRVEILKLTIKADSPEHQTIEQRVQSEGIAFLHQQPGFSRHVAAHLDQHSLVISWEWASEEQAKAGMEQWGEWVQNHGIASSVESVETYAGNVVVSS